MPYYNVKFETIDHTGERIAELSEVKQEKVLAMNQHSAKLYILMKHRKQINIIEIEIIPFSGTLH